ncbi:MAG TPA: chromosomal replication initiator protein DnaA [Blastocatellia bacterium]|nr:chromosomal replication initiator protein DnaA [Blastocatellia bacterium]
MTASSTQIDLLSSILTAISKRVNHQSFNTWFKPISFATKDDSTLYLKVPNEIFRDWISSNYFDVLEESLQELDMEGYQVSFLIEDKQQPKGSNGAKNQEAPPRPSKLASLNNQDISNFGIAKLIEIEPLELPLNPKYTFDTFVVGSCNQFAHAAALAVVDMPSKTYNPLYVYGGVGLGKTHLMHAIGQAIKSRNINLRLTYISSEKFMNELINAIRYDKTITFREKYRNIDVLLMDDIQFLAGKERTQEEFFHTFNALYDAQKQIVISSDCPPREIPTLEERLHSRFEWGLIADIQPPDLETKVAILKRKAEIEKIDLPDNVALFIASKIKSNIRELEGSLVRLVAYASLKGLPIGLELAQEVLKNIIDEETDGVSIELIQKTVATHYGLKVADLKSKNNSRNIAGPRQVAMYLCKTLTKASLPEIGREFGGKHHTTVLHSINKVSQLYDSDGVFHRLINSLITNIK